MNKIEKVRSVFVDRFPQTPTIVRSPGRVNLIGEHTDYNQGFVLPAAVDKAIYFAIAPNYSKEIHAVAIDKDEDFTFQLDKITKSKKGWPNYIMGVVQALEGEGYQCSSGFNLVFGGDIPIGAGMSSSAALECGIIIALDRFFGWGIEKKEMALIAQKAENQFVGVNSGIMDQFACLFGQTGKVLRLDCRSLEYQYFPFEFDDIRIVLCDTGVSHNLAGSEYNTRRRQCEKGVEILSESYPEIKSLRDVSIDQLKAHKEQFDPEIYQRCEYVVEEIERLQLTGDVLQQNDLVAFGKYMYETHAGLSEKYEVSCKELDLLVDYTKNNEAVLGARMMGGGFGGCTINLVKASSLVDFTDKMSKQYLQDTGRELKVYVNQLMQGAEIIPES